MTPKTDSVALLREILDEYPAPNFTAERAALYAAIAALEAQASAPGEVDGDVIHSAIAYFNGLNTKASLHMAAEIEKCYAALTYKEPAPNDPCQCCGVTPSGQITGATAPERI